MFCENIENMIKKLTDAANLAEMNAGPVEELFRRLARKNLRVAVFGQFSSGKSLFLNTILEQPDLLPHDLTPTTRVITELVYGDESEVAVLYRDGSMNEKMSMDEYARLEEVENIKKAFVKIPCEILKQVTFIDTPGLGDPDYLPLDLIYEEIPAADVVVLLLSALRVFTREEQIFIQEKVCRRDTAKIILVLNQVDLLDEEQLKNVLERTGFIAGELLGQQPVLVYSARQAYSGIKENRKDLLEKANFVLVHSLFTEKLLQQQDYLRQAALLNEAMDVLEELESDLNRRRQLAGSSAQEIQQAVQRLAESRRQAEETVSRLQRRTASYVKDLGDHYLTGLRKLSGRLQEDLPRQIKPLQNVEEIRNLLPHYIEYSFKIFLEDYNQEFVFLLNEVIKKVHEEMTLEMKEVFKDLNLKPEFAAGFLTRVKTERSLWQNIGTAATVAGAASLFTGYFIIGALMIGANEVLRRATKKQHELFERDELIRSGQKLVAETGEQVADSFKEQFYKIYTDVFNWVETTWHEQLAGIEAEMNAACERRERFAREQESEEEKLAVFAKVLTDSGQELAELAGDIASKDKFSSLWKEEAENASEDYADLSSDLGVSEAAAENSSAVSEDGSIIPTEGSRQASGSAGKVRNRILNMLKGKK